MWFRAKVSWPNSLCSQERDQERGWCDPELPPLHTWSQTESILPLWTEWYFSFWLQWGGLGFLVFFLMESVKVNQPFNTSSKWFSFFQPPAGGVARVLLVCTAPPINCTILATLASCSWSFPWESVQKTPQEQHFCPPPPKQGWQGVLQGRSQRRVFQRP